MRNISHYLIETFTVQCHQNTSFKFMILVETLKMFTQGRSMVFMEEFFLAVYV